MHGSSANVVALTGRVGSLGLGSGHAPAAEHTVAASFKSGKEKAAQIEEEEEEQEEQAAVPLSKPDQGNNTLNVGDDQLLVVNHNLTAAEAVANEQSGPHDSPDVDMDLPQIQSEPEELAAAGEPSTSVVDHGLSTAKGALDDAVPAVPDEDMDVDEVPPTNYSQMDSSDEDPEVQTSGREPTAVPQEDTSMDTDGNVTEDQGPEVVDEEVRSSLAGEIRSRQTLSNLSSQDDRQEPDEEEGTAEDEQDPEGVRNKEARERKKGKGRKDREEQKKERERKKQAEKEEKEEEKKEKERTKREESLKKKQKQEESEKAKRNAKGKGKASGRSKGVPLSWGIFCHLLGVSIEFIVMCFLLKKR